MIEIEFTKSGAARFATATGNSVGKPLAILVDDKLLSAPVVQEAITGGKAMISGNFTKAEAKRIANGFTGS